MTAHVNKPTASLVTGAATANVAYPANCGEDGVRVFNAGTFAVFVASGLDNTVAATANNQWIAPGTSRLFERNANDKFLAAISPGGASLIYFNTESSQP
jgi:hypothetical protein